ncbi:SCP2 sterol-binding domain-containing protein [Bacillus andreraoultii]|uniref:SCP2 sterol-binding domain-containing protein n=1 Tax=Bacillus andreraoultii TaxID=1499685 RepID=UPI000539728E|nr:SCP2 sterol-binding domain-containing protein [Bacillus andreraoultii]
MSEKLTTLSLEETMQFIEKTLNESPTPIADANVTYQFDISGDEEGSYQLQLQNGKAKVEQAGTAQADCTLVMSFASFRKFLIGKLSGTAAFMTGKLKIKGDIGKAMKLEKILKEYDLKS